LIFVLHPRTSINTVKNKNAVKYFFIMLKCTNETYYLAAKP
jgi:hypothetical protein